MEGGRDTNERSPFKKKHAQKTGDISHPLNVQVSILLLNCDKETMKIKRYLRSLGKDAQSSTQSDSSSFTHCLPKT